MNIQQSLVFSALFLLTNDAVFAHISDSRTVNHANEHLWIGLAIASALVLAIKVGRRRRR